MNDDTIHIHQCALIVSLRCTLKCKLCLVYAPYYKNPRDYALNEIEHSLGSFFDLIDTCGTFNIQGGEPLMHKELAGILKTAAIYKSQIGKILLTTNGTLLPNNDTVEVLRCNSDCFQVNISNYGHSLSPKVSQLVGILADNSIPYRVLNYSGDDLHFGGWLDFNDHTFKWKTEPELIRNAKACGYREGGNLAIRGSEIYYCYRVARRIELGIIEKNEKSFVDMNSNKTRVEKRQNIRDIVNAEYTPACAYCVGKYSDAPHHPPAIQLTSAQMEQKVEVRQ